MNIQQKQAIHRIKFTIIDSFNLPISMVYFMMELQTLSHFQDDCREITQNLNKIFGSTLDGVYHP